MQHEQNDSLKNFDAKCFDLLSKLNAHVTNSTLSDSMEARLLLGRANVDESQRVVLTACAKETDESKSTAKYSTEE